MSNGPYGFLAEIPAQRRHWTLSKVPAAIFAVTIFLTVYSMAGGFRAHDQPLGTFHTQDLVVSNSYAIGSVNAQSTVNGPTLQSFAVPNTAYAFGEINREEISGVVPTPPNDLFVHVIRNHATADCTTADHHSGSLAVEVDGTRTAGTHVLLNTAIECDAVGGQSNECLHVLHGDLVFDGGGAITQNSGTAFFAGTFLAATGPVIAEYNGGPLAAVYISADPGPTDSILSLAADSRWDARHVTLSTLQLYNDSGPFWLKVNAGGGLDGILSPNGVPGLNHGTPSTGSTDWRGDVTAVGANNTVTLTYTTAFPTRSRCAASSLSGGQQVVAVGAAATVVFTCFTMTTGAAANCNDFTYECIGQ